MPVIVISSVIRGIGNACGGVTIWAMVSDTIDYGEWKTGHRTEGLVNSACSFGYKIGNGIGSALLVLSLKSADTWEKRQYSHLPHCFLSDSVLCGFPLLYLLPAL